MSTTTTAQPTVETPLIARTIAATARLVSLTPWQLYQAAQSGELVSHRIDGRLLITDADLREWFSTHRVQDPTTAEGA